MKIDRLELNLWINGMDAVDAHNLPLWVNRRYSLGLKVGGEAGAWTVSASCPQTALDHALMAYRHDKAARAANRGDS